VNCDPYGFEELIEPFRAAGTFHGLVAENGRHTAAPAGAATAASDPVRIAATNSNCRMRRLPLLAGVRAVSARARAFHDLFESIACMPIHADDWRLVNVGSAPTPAPDPTPPPASDPAPTPTPGPVTDPGSSTGSGKRCTKRRDGQGKCKRAVARVGAAATRRKGKRKLHVRSSYQELERRRR